VANTLTQTFSSFQNSFSGSSLKSRVLRGGALLGVGSTMEHGVRFLRNMLLTRILMPEALGVMTIILAINAALESFTEVGVREAVVQHVDAENPSFLNAAWWFSTSRGALLCGLGMLCSWPLASFYHITQARGLLMISFLAIFFYGAISTRIYLALKKMQYARWVAIMQGSALGGVCITVILVFVLRDIRALVYGYIGEAIIRLLLSFILCPFKPSRNFESSQSKELFRFARGMAGIPFLTFLFLEADIFVLGKLVDKHSLGLYGMAESLAGAPAVLIAIFINPILMPAFAQIRDQYSRINNALLKTTRAMSLTGFLLCAWVVLFGEDIMRITYGPAYKTAGSVLAILFFAAVLRTLASPIPAIYLGIGKPALNRSFTAIRTGIILLLIYPAIFFFGLKGAAYAGVISMTIAWMFQIRKMVSLTNLPLRDYCRSIADGLVGSGIVLAVGFLVRFVLGSPIYVYTSAVILSAGVIIFNAPKIIGDLKSGST